MTVAEDRSRSQATGLADGAGVSLTEDAGQVARVCLLGDVMLGGGVAANIAAGVEVFGPDVRPVLAEADLVLANLECCITSVTRRWPAAGKRFYFRAPPIAARVVADTGIDVVSVANNHAMDFGTAGLTDTIDHLHAAGVDVVGGGRNLARARAPFVATVGGLRLAVVAVSDHPAEYRAGRHSAGIAYADLDEGIPAWLAEQVEQAVGACDAVIVFPHWGPNAARAPLPRIRRAADELVSLGASLVAGHSAHVGHGTDGRGVIFDLGDVINDYAPHPQVRWDLGAIWTVDLGRGGPVRARVVPTAVADGVVHLARGADFDQCVAVVESACERFGSRVSRQDDHLLVGMRETRHPAVMS